MNKIREQMLLWFLCGFMVLSCQKSHAAIRDSEQKRVIRQGPITLPILNEHLSEAKRVIFTDIATNMTTLVYKGQVWGSPQRSLSGSLLSPTSPGVYAAHLIDFCAPWYSGIIEKQKEECSAKNRLGKIIFWYKGDYNFGVRMRYDVDSDIEFSESLLAKDSSNKTDECIVAPHELIEETLFKIILTDPNFLVSDKEGNFDLNPTTKSIKQYEKNGTKENVAIRLKDYKKVLPTLVWGGGGDPL